MRKSIIVGTAIFSIALLSVAYASSGKQGQPVKTEQKQEPEAKKAKKPKKAKRTPAQKARHAEEKSNGKAYSGKGNGPAKSQSTKPKKVK